MKYLVFAMISAVLMFVNIGLSLKALQMGQPYLGVPACFVALGAAFLMCICLAKALQSW